MSNPLAPTPAATLQATFIATKTDIDAMIARLQALSADHFNADPDALNWSHIGSLTHIQTSLRAITDFALPA